jgi:hypothetical protein
MYFKQFQVIQFCFLRCNITYSYASDTAPAWPEDGPEGQKHVAKK